MASTSSIAECRHRKINNVLPPMVSLEVATKFFSFEPPLPLGFRAPGGCLVVASSSARVLTSALRGSSWKKPDSWHE